MNAQHTKLVTIFVLVLGAMFAAASVQAQGNDLPGNLRFSLSNVTVGEAVGAVVLTVERIGGDDGAVSVTFSTTAGSAEGGSDYQSVVDTLTWPDDDDDPKTFAVLIVDDLVEEGAESFNVALSNPTGGAGLSQPTLVVVNIADDDDGGGNPNPAVLDFTSASYSVAEGQSTATIAVERTGGLEGVVGVDFTTADGSAVAGSDYSSIAGTLTWADGEGGAKSFNVGIFDDADPESTETVNLSLSAPSGDAILGVRSAAVLSISDDDVETPACVADEDTLCLGEGDRFHAEVSWKTPSGSEGFGQTFDIGLRDSGLFYFFSENNIEMLVKVLDGCSLPQNSFWVFFAATTTVEFELRVTDTLHDITKIYRNDQGQRADAVTDTQAFSTCP